MARFFGDDIARYTKIGLNEVVTVMYRDNDPGAIFSTETYRVRLSDGRTESLVDAAVLTLIRRA